MLFMQLIINNVVKLDSYYEPFERMIEPWSSEIAINWSGRCKTPLLIRDLARLGVTEERITSLPICH